MLQKSSLFSPACIDLSTWGNWHAQLHLLEVKFFYHFLWLQPNLIIINLAGNPWLAVLFRLPQVSLLPPLPSSCCCVGKDADQGFELMLVNVSLNDN